MATLLRADHSRRVELDGVGPVPRPVDIDATQTGFQALQTLRIYQFDPPAVIHGHAEDDEVLILVLEGEIELQIRSDRWSSNEDRFALGTAGGPTRRACAAYLPPGAEYVLTPRTRADVAYVRARPAQERRSPAIFFATASASTGRATLVFAEAAHPERLQVELWAVATADEATRPDFGRLPFDREALVHVRSTPADAVTLDAPGTIPIGVGSWDTVAVPPRERPDFRIAPHAAAHFLIVSAA